MHQHFRSCAFRVLCLDNFLQLHFGKNGPCLSVLTNIRISLAMCLQVPIVDKDADGREGMEAQEAGNGTFYAPP